MWFENVGVCSCIFIWMCVLVRVYWCVCAGECVCVDGCVGVFVQHRRNLFQHKNGRLDLMKPQSLITLRNQRPIW